ncbi:MAG: ABC transporter substrate-binding protein [Azospirillaceae bacterium]|nr:ABC transporter substrate-binding protein [Azospirillaceae bacterium]
MRSRIVLALVMMFGLAVPVQAAPSDDPRQVISGFYDVLLSVMKDADKLGYQGRYQKLDPTLRQVFDLPQMTRIAIGPFWKSIGPDEQKRLVEAFSRYTISTYADRFDGFSGEKFQVGDKKPSDAGGVIVETKLIQSNGEPIALNYLMRQEPGGSWQVIDVFLSGMVSELATRRSEFASVLRKGSAADVINLLESKTRSN